MLYEYDVNTNKFNGLEYETVSRKEAEHIFGSNRRFVEFNDSIVETDTTGNVVVPNNLEEPSKPIFDAIAPGGKPQKSWFTTTVVSENNVVMSNNDSFVEHTVSEVFDEDKYNTAMTEYNLSVQQYDDAKIKYDADLAEYRNLLSAFEQRTLEVDDAIAEQALEELIYKDVPQELIEVGERIRKIWQEVDVELPSGVTVKMDPEYEKDMLAFVSNKSNAGKTFYNAENSDGDKISISFDDAGFLVASFGAAKDAIMNGVE
jgi:exonuclease VII small subunit